MKSSNATDTTPGRLVAFAFGIAITVLLPQTAVSAAADSRGSPQDRLVRVAWPPTTTSLSMVAASWTRRQNTMLSLLVSPVGFGGLDHALLPAFTHWGVVVEI